MTSGRRSVVMAAGGVTVWYVCTLILWAFQPLTDAVPAGVDYTLKAPSPVSIEVECNTLFARADRAGSPLPALKAQPSDKPPLAYSRQSCSQVHQQARILFFLDTTLFVVLLSVGGWLALRRRRPAVGVHFGLSTMPRA
jgi:hypothetical protein